MRKIKLPDKKTALAKLKWIFALLGLILIIYGSYSLSRYVEATQVEKGEVQVVIDAGHGGRDPGKVGVNKALEKDINLQIARKLKKLLEAEGVTVLMTREEDEGLEQPESGQKKVEDMKARVSLINETKPALAVSIHQNSYPDESVQGAQVFYFAHSAEGERIAEVLQKALKTLGDTQVRESKANDTYYLLKRTEVPTVIVECGFLSSWEEAQRLTEDEYQQQLARALCSGIRECLETKERE